MSFRNVVIVEKSAMPSTRAGRKWRWKARTMVFRFGVKDAGDVEIIAIADQRGLQLLNLKSLRAFFKTGAVLYCAGGDIMAKRRPWRDRAQGKNSPGSILR